MPAVDKRLLRASPAARAFAFACVPLGVALALTIVVQATLLGRIIEEVFLGHSDLAGVGWLLVALALSALARGVFAWAFEAGGHVTASATASSLRRRLVRHALGDRPGDPALASGAVTTAAVSGVDALDPYFARYLPQLVLGVVVPLVILVRVVTLDWLSALVMAVTLPLIPIFGMLIGRWTARSRPLALPALAGLSTHFLDVVRGLTTLRAFNRGAVQSERIAEMGERYRRETMGMLRIAFLSALVLELAATLGTAIVAVEIGIRLDHGGIALAPALTILVLAPELYAPLRNVAAQFHASADGIAAAEPHPRPARRPPRAPCRRPRDRRAARSARRAGAPRARVLRLPRPRGRVLDDASLVLAPGGARRARRAERSGQEHDRAPAAALRPALRTAGCSSAASISPKSTATPGGAHRLGAAASALSGRDDRRRDPPRRARSGDRRRRRRGAARRRRGLHRGAAGRLRDARRRRGRGLSAGQIRRIALARALLRDASLLILDEPTTNLDDESAGLVADALERLPRTPTMLLITHDEALARRVADRVVRIADGRIAARSEATT